MSKMKVVRFKGNFEVDLFRDMHLQILFDENLDELIQKEEDGLGEKYIFINAKIEDMKNEESLEYSFWFPIDIEIENIQDLFLNELVLILDYLKKFYPIEWITKSNPDCAWIFYKKTRDNVIRGEEFRKAYKCTFEIECERSDGSHIKLKHLQDGSERLYREGKYLGRIDTIKGNENEILYSGYGMESLPPWFICDTGKEEKFPEGDYKIALEGKSLYWESGIHIYHKGRLRDIVEGLSLATDEFLRRKG